MLRPFSVLVDEAASKAQDTTTSRKTKIKLSMNRYYQSLHRKFMWNEITIIDRAHEVSAASSSFLVDKDIGMLHAITEQLTNIVLQPSSPYVFQARYVSTRTSANTPVGFVIGGTSPVKVQPTAAALIAFISDSASDTTQTITVRYKDSADNKITEEVSLNGTTEVTTTGTVPIGDLLQIVKSARTTGTITIKQGSGGTTLDTIAPDDYTNRLMKVNLNSPTDTTRTFYVTGKKRFRELLYDGDVPEFDCCDALVHYAVAEVHEAREKFTLGLAEKSQGDRYIDDLVTEKEIYAEGGKQDTLPAISFNSIDIPVLSGGS